MTQAIWPLLKDLNMLHLTSGQWPHPECVQVGGGNAVAALHLGYNKLVCPCTDIMAPGIARPHHVCSAIHSLAQHHGLYQA